MRKLVKALLFFSFLGPLLSLCSLSQGIAREKEPFLAPVPFSSKGVSIQFVTGYLHSPLFQKRERPVLDYWQNDLRIGRTLSGLFKEDSPWRGCFQGFLEITYSDLTKGPGDHMAGLSLLLRYSFLPKDLRLVPYLQIGAGVIHNDIYKDESQGLVGQAIEFTPQASAGLSYLIKNNLSLDLEAMFHHVSNAGLDERNIGINAIGGFFGLTYHFDSRP